MDKKTLIEVLFDKLAVDIIKDVNVKYQDELLNEYKNYLIKEYSKYNDNSSKFDLYIDYFSNFEISKWSDLSEGEKLSLLLKDPALEEIGSLSYDSYYSAVDRFNGKLLESDLNKEEINKKIEKLQELLSKVREFNKGLAANLVSESILDYNYVLGEKENTSIRIGRLN